MSLPSAYHLLASRQDDYYHWLVDILARFNRAQFEALGVGPEAAGSPVLLMPPLNLPFQWESVDLVVPRDLPRAAVRPISTLRVQRLLYIPPLHRDGALPHRAMLTVFDRMRAAAYGRQPPPEGPPRRRIYVAGGDAAAGALENEAEVVARVARAGFAVVEPANLSVAEQVRTFAEASHVIGPQGPGLANLAFCRPGAIVCEVQMRGRADRSFRWLAALRDLRYGRLVGEAAGGMAASADGKHWKLDPAALEAVLTADEFAPV